ncbi:sterol desaturase family protein [Rhizobium oryzicola]|uniref:Sterol desaturase family protein n=1 Tax=Rhizobium oryzicola TaxID=1232668 RepID=A0ABT8SVI0_9HYPH|nr:sterol desaturase family protein [Rhizobium oryzicola]MDO1582356.1 sterol desaturase family protein [Rhizobium oryzicola]
MLYAFASRTLWPLFFIGGLIGAHFAFQSSAPLFWFNVTYLTVIAGIALAERLMPFEKTWLARDGETFNDVAHTMLSKGAVQILAAISASLPMGVATLVQPLTSGIFHVWPDQLPMFAQVVLGLVTAELGLYLAHRFAHENLYMWRFHALHHSVGRLWVVNTGRFHFIDSGFKIALSQIPLYLLGAPLPVFLWIGAVTAFIGLLTHCNIDVRTGFLDYIFSTPRLHRWHHSLDLAEGNTNYGENLVVWDQLLGTYFNPPREPTTKIGITGRVADNFIGQLVQPFSYKGSRKILGKKPQSVIEAEARKAEAKRQAEMSRQTN